MRLFDKFDNFKLTDPLTIIPDMKEKVQVVKRVISRGRVRQVDVYCLLKEQFGMPNGLQSFLRGNHSGNIFHWNYNVNFDEIHIDILSSTRFFEFNISSADPEALTDFNEDEFIKSLQDLIKRNSKKISKFKENLEFWYLSLNTYKRLESVTEYNFEQYSKINYKEPILSSHLVSERQAKIYNHQLGKYTEKILLKKNYGIVLRMLYPVQAESLLNLIILILAKEEIKSDQRLLDNVFRSQIDIRVKTLHLNCYGLVTPYNQNDERFKNFLRMMNDRNDFLHGNVYPSKLKFDEVFFDGTIPLFLEEKDLSVEFAKQNMFQISNNEIESSRQTVLDFKEYLLENIEDEQKNQVELIINRSQIGWNPKNGRLGDLFNDEMITPMFILK